MGSLPGEDHVDAAGLPIQSSLEDDLGALGYVAVAVFDVRQASAGEARP